ncbi:MAG: AMIN domain-containing protein, partial [Porticoccus sp.]
MLILRNICLVFIALVFTSQSLAAATVNSVRVWRAPDHTRLVFDLSKPVAHKVFSLEGPDRLVIDIDDTSLNASTAGLDLGKSPITSIRTGENKQKNLRIVLDLKEAVRPRS